MAERTTPPFKAALVFTDSTPNAIVNNRIAKRGIEIAQRYTDLKQDEQSDFFDVVILTSRKMVSVWKHLDGYRREEDRLLSEFEKGGEHIDYGQELFTEFDEFAVQIKSTLDHVVKAMRPMVGKCWTIGTFGDKGDKVTDSLDRNVPRGFAFKIDFMKRVCFTAERKLWLDAIIGARDCINHLQDGGIAIKKFSLFRDTDGTVQVPQWSNEQNLRDAMGGLWNEFFFLIEDFIICSLHFRLSSGLSLMRKPSPITSPDSAWSVMSEHIAQQMIESLPFKKMVIARRDE